MAILLTVVEIALKFIKTLLLCLVRSSFLNCYGPCNFLQRKREKKKHINEHKTNDSVLYIKRKFLRLRRIQTWPQIDTHTLNQSTKVATTEVP